MYCLTCQIRQVAWDDDEKDYSDLPDDVLQPHRRQQAADDEAKRLEAGSRAEAAALQRLEDKRREQRTLRLRQLRATPNAFRWPLC